MRRHALAIVVAVLAGAGLHAPASAARDGGARWTWTLGLERRVDDNILQMTPHDQARFAENPTSSRFRVVSVGDGATGVQGELRWRARPWHRRESSLALAAAGTFYDDNGVKDSQTYALRGAQELTVRRRSLLRATAFVERTPRYYLLEVTDADASFLAQRRIRRSLAYGETVYGGALTQDAWHGRLAFTAGGERAVRDYGTDFRERDNHRTTWRAGAEVHPRERTGWSVAATYFTGALTARGDLPDTEVRDTDISYDRHGVTLAATLPWGGRHRGRLDAWWTPETRHYTTADKFDVTRFDRTSHRTETGARWTQRLARAWDAQLAARHLSTDSEFPAGTYVDPQDVDFAQTRVSLAVRVHGR